jgi:putative transposase
MHRTRYRSRSRAQDQPPLRRRIREIAAVRVRYGYRRVHPLLRREGWPINLKRVSRLYRLDGLSLRLKAHKKRVSAPRLVPPPPQAPNEQWSMDAHERAACTTADPPLSGLYVRREHES